MDKTKITVATIGHMPADFNKSKISSWSSDVFEITGEIERGGTLGVPPTLEEELAEIEASQADVSGDIFGSFTDMIREAEASADLRRIT